MNDSSYYQKKREAERIEQNKNIPRQPMSEEKLNLITVSVFFVVLIVFLFVMLAKALEEGRNECESKGGEWHSTMAGKVVITDCEIKH